jgi:CDP-diacylglycerol--serine O-phosphatidyltransferase
MTRTQIHPGRRQRGFRALKTVPVLPSMVTLGNLFFGFLAMAKVADAARISGPPLDISSAPVIALFEAGALLVFVAMLFDGLDGAVARITRQTSKFGAHLDSLADMVTFGIAPAFMAKVLIDFNSQAGSGLLPVHPKLYYAVAAIYALCAAMRLARFNVEVESPTEEDHREFSGLPSPAAAAVVCSLIAFVATREDSKAMISGKVLPPQIYDAIIVALPMTLVALGLLMVSRFPYPHMINAVVRGRHSFPFLATLVVMVFVAAIEWQFALAALTVLYVLSGIVLGAFRLLTRGTMAPVPLAVDEEADDALAGEDDFGARLRRGGPTAPDRN